MAKKSLKNVPFSEWVWYLIGAIFAAWGIAEIICGLVLEFGNNVIEWPLNAANTRYIELFGLSFLHWGLILLAIGTLTAVIVLCVTAGKYDRESEKQSRRAARLHKVVEEAEVVAEEVESAEAK